MPVILYDMPSEIARVAESVTALPALPDDDPASRYGVRRLTATWLAELAGHTRVAYFRDLAHYLAWCQREALDPRTARPSDLSAYRTRLDHLAAASVHRRLAAISSWYRYLVANSDGAVPANPATAVRRPSVDRDASATAGLTAEEVRALLAAADAAVAARTGGAPARHLASLRDRALLRLLAGLGLRIGEALALDVDSLTHNQGRRTVRYLAKGGRWRERPLPAPAQAALDDYLAARARAADVPVARLTGALFATTGRTSAAGRLGEPAAFRLVRRLAADAQLPAAGRLSPHSLRHAFATNARELGVPLEDVQDAMGHADARTTRRYDRGRYALQRDPSLRLGELYSGPQR
jgi:integrase/recombinase XerD